MSVDLPDLCLPTKATETAFSFRSAITLLSSVGPTIVSKHLAASYGFLRANNEYLFINLYHATTYLTN